MARNSRYISGDSHLEIDAKWWVDRVPKKYREQAPRLVRLPDGSDAWAHWLSGATQTSAASASADLVRATHLPCDQLCIGVQAERKGVP